MEIFFNIHNEAYFKTEEFDPGLKRISMLIKELFSLKD